MPVPIVCAGCGETFTVKPSHAARYNRTYCSNACRKAATQRKWQRTCEQCGATFHMEYASEGRFCSNDCYAEYRRSLPPDEREALMAATRSNSGSKPKPLSYFWSLVDQSGGDTACWEWQGTITAYGYGQLKRSGKSIRAHRFIFEQANGPIPDDLVVRHACDNRRCCNPAHLELGTHDENMADAVSRDRMASGDRAFARLHPERVSRGERHGMAKLTESDVLAIVAKQQGGVTVAELASEYGVCVNSIHNILTGKTWKHVTRPLAELTEQGQGPGCR